nr:MAG TPA_asm: hypothetical protein [Caudoviricetes sp.]
MTMLTALIAVAKVARGFTIAPGNVIQVTNGNTVVNKFKGEQNYDYH